jgi:hypothetical protein
MMRMDDGGWEWMMAAEGAFDIVTGPQLPVHLRVLACLIDLQ